MRREQSKLKQRRQTESTRQKVRAQEERSRPGGTVSRQGNEQGRQGCGQSLPTCTSDRSLRGHEEHAAGLGTKAMKVSVVTAMCCFWEGHLLPQLSMVVSVNFGFSSVHSRNRALVYYRTIPPGFYPLPPRAFWVQGTRRGLIAAYIFSPPPTGHAV